MKAGTFFKILMIISFYAGSLMLNAQTNTNTNKDNNTGTGTGTNTNTNTNDTKKNTGSDINDPNKNNINSNQATDDNPQDKTGTKTTNSRTDAPGMRPQDNKEDMDFVEEAASGGMMEVELGRLAQQKGQNPRVTAFGAMMVRDHTKANGELKSVAMRKNITLKSEMKDKHHQHLEKFSDKSGADFDKDYIDLMVDDHQDDLDLFRKEAEKGNDIDLKNFASKTIAVLQMHLDSARAIQSSLKWNK